MTIRDEDLADLRTVGDVADYIQRREKCASRARRSLNGRLRCLQVLAVGNKQKLFESEIASLCITSRAV